MHNMLFCKLGVFIVARSIPSVIFSDNTDFLKLVISVDHNLLIAQATQELKRLIKVETLVLNFMSIAGQNHFCTVSQRFFQQEGMGIGFGPPLFGDGAVV